MTDIPRARLIELRDKCIRDQATHLANLNGVNGAIQAIDLLLAPEPETVLAGAVASGGLPDAVGT